MREGFQLAHESSFSAEEREEHEDSLNHSREQIREQLAALAERPSVRLFSLEMHLEQKYGAEWHENTDAPIPEVSVYFIPDSKRSEVEALVRGSGFNAICDPFSRSVVVLIKDIPGSEVSAARDLAHELAHAYSKSFIQYKPASEQGKPEFLQGLGVVAITPKRGSHGNALEEFYAVSREIEMEKEIARFYPAEAEFSTTTLAHLTTTMEIAPEDAPYVHPWRINEAGNYAYSTSGHMPIHRMVSESFMSKVPDFMKHLKLARVTGHWAELQTAIDKALGPLTFKTVMNVTADNESIGLFRQFLDTDDPNMRRVLSNQILNHESRKSPARVQESS